ncbi:hypothetical protein [Erwinia sp. E_sp_W01_6]|uniref:hypothetical protein n=1 Tax=Erwinia sp. E_sp_W01_6 TaxID=3039408 RepID=UPI0030D40A80
MEDSHIFPALSDDCCKRVYVCKRQYGYYPGSGLFLGALQGGLASGLTPAFSELYPTHIRGNGAGFCASFGRGFGSLMPALVGILSSHIHLGYAMGSLAITSYCVGILAALCLPNATGVNLAEVN